VQIEKRCSQRRPGAFLFCILTAFILCGSALAKDPPGSYPETGKVIDKGMNPHVNNFVRVANGSVSGTSTSSTSFTHIYRVETAQRIFALDCLKYKAFKMKDCGGENGMQIGDVIHLRIEKGWAYVPLPGGKEDKLQILSDEAKPEDQPR
jgi:hypothetical protein